MNEGEKDHDVPASLTASPRADDREDLLRELDRLAAPMVESGRAKRVEPRLEGMGADELEGHAWAQVLAAAALQGDSDCSDPRIERFLMSAEDEFWREGDEPGLGFVAYVRGNGALIRGDLPDASGWWRQAREYLGEDGGPLNEIALAHLSLAEYHSGRLRDAVATAEEALALARRRRNRRAEGLALLYLAFFSLWVGEFGRAETLLTTSRRIYTELKDPLERFELPLVDTGLAALQAIRWHRTSAEAMFEAALQMSESLGTRWFTAIVLANRAELCAAWNPARSIADANQAIEFLEDTMSDAWWGRWARRSLAAADMHAGNLQTSRQTLEDLLGQQMNAIERVWTLLGYAQTCHRSGDASAARAALDESLHLSDVSGSKYHKARAMALLSDVDIERRQEWRRRMTEITDRDPAYRVLLMSSSPLQIEAWGRGRILVGDRPAKFATRHAEAAVFILALAGYDGVNAETLAERLWPNVASSVWPGRVRTLLWQMRRTLGDESWRLERDGTVIRLDLAGAHFDVDEAKHLARGVLQGLSVPADSHQRLLAELRQPLLSAHQYEEWVSDYANELRVLEAKVAARPDAG
jgi:tetratricopeptide (TPR) repeat protein